VVSALLINELTRRRKLGADAAIVLVGTSVFAVAWLLSADAGKERAVGPSSPAR
jgi:ABC-type Mn2+/Zn2+ transport system permease subunit